MKIYDVLVIGNDVTAFYAAASLSQKGYQVAHVNPDQPQLKETTNKMVSHSVESTFFGRSGISEYYLKKTNLKARSSQKDLVFKEILSDGRVLSRSLERSALRRYLIRHFPQEHLAINAWFKKRRQEYRAWAAALQNWFETGTEEYLPWLEAYKEMDVQTLMDQSFNDPMLKESIQVTRAFHGYQLYQIKALDYILHWFWLIEEDATLFDYHRDDLIKHFKKQSPGVDHLKSTLAKTEFKTDQYQVSLKNKESFAARFILGQHARHDDDDVIYRQIDVVCDPLFYQKHFETEVHFKATPLFESLRLIPMHHFSKNLKHHLRLETVSEANRDLILTFVDRYYKGFEAQIVEAVEYPQFRKRTREVEDTLSETLNVESRWALWDEPKWLQIDLNTQPKSLLPSRLFKTDYFLQKFEAALENETHPHASSVVVQSFNRLALRFEYDPPLEMAFQLGFQSLYLSSSKQGAMISQAASDVVFELSPEAFLALEASDFSHEAIENTALKKSQKEILIQALNREVEPLKYPLGFLHLGFVILLLSVVMSIPFNATLTFLVSAIIGLLSLIRWLVFRRITGFEIGIIVVFILVSFLQLNRPLNVGIFLAFYGILGWILQFRPAGMLKGFFHQDPLRTQLSQKYLDKFSQRMTWITSTALILLSFGAGFETIGASIVAGILAIVIFIIGYFKPLKPDMKEA
jgi:hypothetical protein